MGGDWLFLGTINHIIDKLVIFRAKMIPQISEFQREAILLKLVSGQLHFPGTLFQLYLSRCREYARLFCFMSHPVSTSKR